MLKTGIKKRLTGHNRIFFKGKIQYIDVVSQKDN